MKKSTGKPPYRDDSSQRNVLVSEAGASKKPKKGKVSLKKHTHPTLIGEQIRRHTRQTKQDQEKKIQESLQTMRKVWLEEAQKRASLFLKGQSTVSYD